MSGPIHQFDEAYGKARVSPELAAAGSRRPLKSGEQPLVGVVYNPRSHRNKGQDLVVAGLPNVTVGLPHGREQITEVLAGFARQGIDYLIINGGDGTVRDVLTCGQTVFGDDWPEIAFLPKGKTNALNVDLGAPTGWSLEDAIHAFAGGKRVKRSPVTVTRLDGEETTVRGFILGAGIFTNAVEAGQGAHKMGAFNSLVIAVTAFWGAVQVLLGTDRNPWRRGSGITIDLLPSGNPLERSRFGAADRRSVILASTLHRFPMGVKLFSDIDGELKLAALDHPRRRLIGMLPAILLGYLPDWLGKAGLHRLSVDAFEMTLEDPFILDGEAFPPGKYRVAAGAPLTFVTP